MSEQLDIYLDALFGDFADQYVEVRYRLPVGMRQAFFPASARDDARRMIRRFGRRTDVYIGVLPRWVPGGDRGAVASGSVVWADCDHTDARFRLQRFTPRPGLVVRSGSPGACHAYWLLDRPLNVADLERLNRRLALALDADDRATDGGRVLRPPGTHNFKHAPAGQVEIACHHDERIDPLRLDRALPRLPPAQLASRRRGARLRGDALLDVEPAEYIGVLLGVQVRPDRKARCPFHDDDAPSLHVYRSAARGWYCYGCGRGGSIYDFAGLLWNCDTRGADFLELRARLRRMFSL